MKKFAAGVLCGIVLSTVTAVSAAVPINSFLTRATIGIYANGTSSLSQADETEMLTYQNHIYVPLRWFSEKMGATVDYLPADTGRLPHVSLYSENNSNFTITDETKSVSLAHVKLDFGDPSDPSLKMPTITGVIRTDKAIGKGKEIVLEIKDKSGRVIGRSEYLKAGGRDDYRQTGAMSINQFKPGEIRTFRTHFPYVIPPESYEIGVTIVDSTPWHYVQEGSYAQEESPFDIGLDSNLGKGMALRRGIALQFTASITNTTDKPLKIVKANFVLSLGKEAIKLEPIDQMVVPGNHGSLKNSVTWTVSLPPGESGAELKLPVTIQYEEDGVLKTTQAAAGVFTNAIVPFTVVK